MSVKVFSSSFITDTYDSPLFLNNATVSVYTNEELVEVLTPLSDGDYKSTTHYPQAGITYTLKVEVPNMGTAISEAEVLHPVQVLGFDSVGIYKSDMWSDEMIKAHIRIKDPSNKNNYYRLTLWSYSYEFHYDSENHLIIGTIPYISQLEPMSNDPVFEEGTYGEFVFSDALINGKEYNLEVLISKYTSNPDIRFILAVLEHISYDYYQYGISLPAHFDAEDMKMFFEAVLVHNNIQNGIGIFGTSSQSTDTLYNSNFAKPYTEN